jgi:hypothetical protein
VDYLISYYGLLGNKLQKERLSQWGTYRIPDGMYCILLAVGNSACSLPWYMLLFLVKVTVSSSENFK